MHTVQVDDAYQEKQVIYHGIRNLTFLFLHYFSIYCTIIPAPLHERYERDSKSMEAPKEKNEESDGEIRALL